MKFLQKLFGYSALFDEIQGLRQDMERFRIGLHSKFDQLHQDMVTMRSDFTVTLGDELSPQRQKASQVLGNMVTKRLQAEQAARDKTVYGDAADE